MLKPTAVHLVSLFSWLQSWHWSKFVLVSGSQGTIRALPSRCRSRTCQSPQSRPPPCKESSPASVESGEDDEDDENFLEEIRDVTCS